MRKNLVLTPLMAFIASGCGALVAQDFTTAVLSGRVTSQDGTPLQGVRVQLSSPALLQTRQTVTAADGQFRVPLLPGGEYNITYSLNGYVTRRLSLRIVAGQTINGSTRLTSIAAQETTVEITATAGIAQVDKTDTVVQTTLSAEYMRQLKTVNDLSSLGQLIPGVNTNDGGRFRVRGGTAGGVKIIMDGQSAMEASGGYFGSTAQLPQDLIESVAVLQSPTNARYGNTDGGIVSMVTSKGSNSFSGTFRITGLRRSFWGVTDRGYLTRDGFLNSVPTPSNDNLARNYEYTLQGPIWKDYITFAYAGRITPPREGTDTWNRGQWTDRSRGPLPEDQVGLYYQDPTNGLVIRRSELGSLQDPFGVFGTKYQTLYNHFSVYAQITPNHQLDYSYRDSITTDSPRSPRNGSNSREILQGDSDDEISRFWTIGYKGIIGNAGILEIRHGYNSTGWLQTGVNDISTRVYTIASVVPIAGTYSNNNWVINNYSNNDPTNFRASGYVDYALNTNDGIRSHTFGGRDDVGRGADFGTLATTVNYQQLFQTEYGTHLIDVGFQNDKFRNNSMGPRAADFIAAGQTPKNLTAADFYNPNGVRIDPADYANRFIVFNVYGATLGDIDPYGINRYIANNPGTSLTANTRLFDGQPIGGGQASRVANFLPRVNVNFGEGSPGFYTQMRSYYVNDLWTVNDRHSVMLGLRMDNWKFWDATRDIHSYSKITPRFDYKWDIHGDQSRLASLSFAQYHNQHRNQTFGQFVVPIRPHSGTRYWNQSNPNGNPNAPYLVTYEQFTDLSNYGDLYSPNYRSLDSSEIDPNWKSPTSTEFAVAFARNLSNGGSWKLTLVKRSWSDLSDAFLGDIYTTPSGQKQNKTLLKNTDVWERDYSGVEFEWHVPVTKRLVFAGSYTYARLMSNENNNSDGSDGGTGYAWFSTTANAADLFDQFWPREVWAYKTPRQMEHNFKFQLIQDLSLGNLKSTVALYGNWQSATYSIRSFAQYTGLQIIPGVNEYTYGGAGQNTNNLTVGRNIPINIASGADSWYTSLRYNLDMPLYKKLIWFMTVDIWNPFNHRGKQFSSTGTGPDSRGQIYLVDLVQLNANGTTSIIGAKNGPLGPYNGVWRSDGNVNGLYRDYSGGGGGRSLTVQTGLRF